MGGGMPTRVTVPESRRDEVMSKLQALVAERPLKPDARDAGPGA